MTRYITLTIMIVALLGFIAPVMAQSGAQSGILIVNRDEVFANSLAGKSIISQIQEQANALIANRDKAQTELESESKKLEGQRTLLAPEVYSTRADALRLKGTAKTQELKREQRKMELGQDNARVEFNKVFRAIVQEIMVEKKAITVLERRSVYTASPDVDITDIVLKRLDTRLKSVKVEPPAAQN